MSEKDVEAFGLPRAARIATRNEITELQRRGKKIHCPGFLISYRKKTSGIPRLAITVSKKVDKRAVVRNLIKRRVRTVFRYLSPNLAPLDIVIIARSAITSCPYSEYEKQITKALQSHKLMKSVEAVK